MANIDPLAEDLISLDESEDITDNSETMAKDTNCYMRDTIMGLHRYVRVLHVFRNIQKRYVLISYNWFKNCTKLIS